MKNADLRMKIGAVFRSCSKIICLAAGPPLSEGPGVHRPYGRAGLTYRIIAWVVPLPEQSHMRKEAGHEEGYHVRGPR